MKANSNPMNTVAKANIAENPVTAKPTMNSKGSAKKIVVSNPNLNLEATTK